MTPSQKGDPKRGYRKLLSAADDLRYLAESENPVAPIAEELLNIIETPVRNGFVYVIESKPGVVKMGISNEPRRRLNGLAVGNHHKLELLTAVKVPEPEQLERDLHQEYHEYRTRGEWFDVGESNIKNLIDRVEVLAEKYSSPKRAE